MSNQPPNEPSDERKEFQNGNGGQQTNPPPEWWLQDGKPGEPEVDRKQTPGQKRLIITLAIVGGAVVLIPLLLFGACFLLLAGF